MINKNTGPQSVMGDALLIGKAADRESGSTTLRHQHEVIQLLYAVSGVMRVITAYGQWIVPPNRGIWLPVGVWHEVHMLAQVEMRSVYIRPDALPNLPQQCCVLAITPLLRELILAAVHFDRAYPPDSREGRIIRLLLDEIISIPSLPMVLPMPADAGLRSICEQLLAAPDDNRSSESWAQKINVDARTLQRRFNKSTGMTFGEWRRQARLLTALERLACGERVIDIALESGYASPSAFTAMFKRQFGVAPSEFFK
ncbi:helix-turn-helix transcriptional regulator [Iodobacter sp. CM08]|uniref:AraC family transcriptional regulator n=1 Tax=Iodobacter sp. CM08 TaxID=3085902 RepID=UPI002982077E|nr:helix-turn-helix transcriptional regulator [Iodobacter sp. CM08]MDW5418357.1 helix-turn-helix transcriptional regulator [Iodobacter sp. CM08]